MKTLYTKILIVLAHTLIFCECQRNSTAEDIATSESLQFIIAQDTDISAIVDSVEYIPLSESDTYIIPEISKVCTTPNLIAVGSKKYGKINVYDRNGNFLYKIDKRGKGEGEYLEIANFTFTDNAIYIIDNFLHHIHEYSSVDGKHLKSTPIPFIAWDLEAFNDKSFLFTMIPNNPHANLDLEQSADFAVWRTNDNWEIEKTYIPLQQDYHEMYGKSRYFTKNGDNILFHTLKDNGYYILNNESAPQFVKTQFENPLPSDFEGMVDEADRLNYEYVTETPFVGNNWRIMRISHDGYEDQFLYNEETKKFVQNSDTTAKNGLIEIIGILDDSPVGIIPDYDTYRILVDNGFAKADSKSEDLLEKGGIVMVKYKI